MYLLKTIGHPGTPNIYPRLPWESGTQPEKGFLTFLVQFFGFWIFTQKLHVGVGLYSIQCFFWAIMFTWYQIYTRSMLRELPTQPHNKNFSPFSTSRSAGYNASNCTSIATSVHPTIFFLFLQSYVQDWIEISPSCFAGYKASSGY